MTNKLALVKKKQKKQKKKLSLITNRQGSPVRTAHYEYANGYNCGTQYSTEQF